MNGAPYARSVSGGLELRVKVVPGASRTRLAGSLGDRLKVRIAAPPEDGLANRALLTLISAWLGRKTVLISGAGHAEKTLLVPGLSELPPPALATQDGYQA